MIAFENIHLDLSGFSLKNINLEIREKDFFALIGPTGSGKSLLLEGIMGLMDFSSGGVRFKGRDMTAVPVELRNLAIVYQDFALFPHLDVTQNILYGTKYHKISKKEVSDRLSMLVSTLGLENILDRRPHNLSGGEKQRVALARSLILNPKVLLLDEPLSALDPLFHNEAKHLLEKIHQELDMTIVMVSHNFNDVIYLANRGAIIHKGQIHQQGDIITLFEKPASRFIADFVGMRNIRPVVVQQGQLKIQDSGLDILASDLTESGHWHMGIRPEEIVLNPNGADLWANRFEGRIKKISNHGVFLDLVLSTQDMDFEAIWPRSYLRDHKLEVGQTVGFAFHPESVHIF
ncbi:MAG: ABC transporter ATP-binding protein [Desulfobacter sp.]|nr:MAG: ABC transporter ATP-binding protein [Desulfobacter sp.]